jgi:hypothetical protein
VFLGADTPQDLVMTGAAVTPTDTLDSQDFLNPATIPAGGQWLSWFDIPGGTNYYTITAKVNRTLSLEVTTIDEHGNATQEKAQPVIGLWPLAASPGVRPRFATQYAFNTAAPGVSRLNATVPATGPYRFGITDLRNDGRPDYAHHVRVLYADTISPERVNAGGDTLQVLGTGFQPNLAVHVGGVAASVVDFSANS